jgi:hypothetical protein
VQLWLHGWYFFAIVITQGKFCEYVGLIGF